MERSRSELLDSSLRCHLSQSLSLSHWDFQSLHCSCFLLIQKLSFSVLLDCWFLFQNLVMMSPCWGINMISNMGTKATSILWKLGKDLVAKIFFLRFCWIASFSVLKPVMESSCWGMTWGSLPYFEMLGCLLGLLGMAPD